MKGKTAYWRGEKKKKRTTRFLEQRDWFSFEKKRGEKDSPNYERKTDLKGQGKLQTGRLSYCSQSKRREERGSPGGKKGKGEKRTGDL